MLHFTDATPIYLFTAPTDMRKSFDGLSGLIARHLGASSVTDGALSVFINRRRDRMKVIKKLFPPQVSLVTEQSPLVEWLGFIGGWRSRIQPAMAYE